MFPQLYLNGSRKQGKPLFLFSSVVLGHLGLEGERGEKQAIQFEAVDFEVRPSVSSSPSLPSSVTLKQRQSL